MSVEAKKPESFADAIAKGVFWVSFGATGIRVIGFVVSVFLLRFLSLHEYGTYQLVLSIGGLLALLSFQGLEQLVVAAGARALGRNDDDEAKKIGQGFFLLRLGLGVALWFFTFFGSFFLSRFYGSDLLVLVRIYSWVFLILPLEKIISYHFSVHRKFQMVCVFLFFQESVKLVAILGSFFLLHAGVSGVIASMPIAMLIACLVFFPFTGRPYVTAKVRSAFAGVWPLVKDQGIWVVGQRGLREAERNFRPLLIQAFLGREAVALFSLGERAYSYVAGLFPIDEVLMPSIAAETDNRARLQRILERGIKYTVPFYGAVAFAFFWLSPVLVQVAFPQYVPAIPLLRVLSFYVPFIGVAYLLTSFYLSHLEQKKLFLLLSGRLVFFFLTIPLWLMAFGVVGGMLELIATLFIFNVARLVTLLRTYPELRIRWRSVFSIDDYDREAAKRLFSRFVRFFT